MKSNTIEIQGLPAAVTVPAMANIAKKYGNLSRLVVQRDSGIRPEGPRCWITFHSHRDAVAALTDIGERYLGHRTVAVSWATPETAGGLRPR